MKNAMKKYMIAAVAAAFLPSGLAQAAPMVLVKILGSTDNGATWSSSVSAAANSTVMVKVTAELASVGTSNSNNANAILSTSPGVSSLQFNLIASGSDDLWSAESLQAGWNTTSNGANDGVATDSGLVGIRPIQPTGMFDGGVGIPSTLLTANLNVGSLTGAETVSGHWAAGYTGLFRVKAGPGGSPAITFATESGADPYVSFSGLTISAAPVPEPAALSILAVGGVAALMGRRNRR